MDTQFVYGAFGELTVDRATGAVLQYNHSSEGAEYEDIARIDVNTLPSDGNNIHILFVGYWMVNGAYEFPVEN